MNIGYIGLGAMGSALARKLLAQHSLSVWDLNPAAIESMVQLGAKTVASPLELARTSEVVILCLPRSSDVREVIFGAGGLADGLTPGTVVIDQTSGTPDETREIAARLAERRVEMIDAAVSGNPMVFKAGGGTIMASGAMAVYQRVLPILREFSANVLHCGLRLGDAQAMKLVNNTMNAGCRLATLEAVALGRKLGLSLPLLTEVLNRGPARNRTTQVMLPALIDGRPSTNFALKLMLKDLVQSTRLGLDLDVPMPFATSVRALLQIGVNTLGADARLEDVVPLIESMAGTRITETADPGVATAPLADGESARLAGLVEDAVWACNQLATCEGAAMGLKFGLTLEAMDKVLNSSSGWNDASEQILPSLASGAGFAGAQPDKLMRALQAAISTAVTCGAPMLIANAACGVLQAGR